MKLRGSIFLLGEGVLNIPDIDTINIKQAYAFLWNAAWLQEYKTRQWRDEGVLPRLATTSEVIDMHEFSLAIMGPGGTGKTTVLRTVEALTEFFTGPNTVRKLAPSNAAARLLGGDTLHALCRLPFGKATLKSKRGRLGKTSLRSHRQQWDSVVQAFLDEVSMIPSDQLLQCDVRMRQAKMQEQQRFGGLCTVLCGDFLQLPPVDKHGTRKSLAKPVDASGGVLPDTLAVDVESAKLI